MDFPINFLKGEERGLATVSEDRPCVDVAVVVGKLSGIVHVAASIFRNDDLSGGYFTLLSARNGQELMTFQLGQFNHNGEAGKCLSSVREKTCSSAGTSASLPAVGMGVMRSDDFVFSFVGLSPQIDAAITLVFAVAILAIRPGQGNKLARSFGALPQFKKLFDEVESAGNIFV